MVVLSLVLVPAPVLFVGGGRLSREKKTCTHSFLLLFPSRQILSTKSVIAGTHAEPL